MLSSLKPVIWNHVPGSMWVLHTIRRQTLCRHNTFVTVSFCYRFHSTLVFHDSTRIALLIVLHGYKKYVQKNQMHLYKRNVSQVKKLDCIIVSGDSELKKKRVQEVKLFYRE